jgi:hypothetical protein
MADLPDVLLLVFMFFILIMFIIEGIKDLNKSKRDMRNHNEEIRNIYLRRGMKVGWLFIYSKEEIKDEQ